MPDMTPKETLVDIIFNIDQTCFEILNLSGNSTEELPNNVL